MSVHTVTRLRPWSEALRLMQAGRQTGTTVASFILCQRLINYMEGVQARSIMTEMTCRHVCVQLVLGILTDKSELGSADAIPLSAEALAELISSPGRREAAVGPRVTNEDTTVEVTILLGLTVPHHLLFIFLLPLRPNMGGHVDHRRISQNVV